MAVGSLYPNCKLSEPSCSCLYTNCTFQTICCSDDVLCLGDINWVQCDSCEKWFHLLCIGLGEDEVSETEDYVCFSCKHPKPQPRARPRMSQPGGITIPATAHPHVGGMAQYDFHDEPSLSLQQQQQQQAASVHHHGLPQLAPPPSQLQQTQPYHKLQHKSHPMMHVIGGGGEPHSIDSLLAAAETQRLMEHSAAESLSSLHAPVLHHQPPPPQSQMQQQADDEVDEDQEDIAIEDCH